MRRFGLVELVGAFLAAFAFIGYFSGGLADAQSLPGNTTSETVLGFDMWCLEIAILPQARCETRRGEDLKTYQDYRATLERYQQERDARTRKEREFIDRLQRDPKARPEQGLDWIAPTGR